MYGSVITFSDDNAAITAPIPAYGTILTAFKAKNTAIETTAQLEAQVISGITINKGDLKKSLCISSTELAGAVFAYAVSATDPVLQQKANFAYSEFFKLKDDELTFVVQNLHDAANTVVASLTSYGVTAATLTAFQDLIDEYNDNVTAPRNAVALRKTYVTQLKTLFKEGDTILKDQLDKVALQFKVTQPTFYTTYKNNRIIVNAPTSPTQAKGTILDSITNLPVYNVLITVFGQSYVATSELDGTYSLKIPVPGIYTIIFTKDGYQTTQAVNVEVKLGQSTIVDVLLIPIP